MTVEEMNPELFIWELYDPNGTWSLDDALYAAKRFGYCDASRLQVRPRSGEYALMVEWENGEKNWFHVTPRLLELVKKRLSKRCSAEDEKEDEK